MIRTLLSAALAAAVFMVGAGAAHAQQNSDAIERLRFLSGSWQCTGALPNGTQYTATRTYAFPSGSPWMQETIMTQTGSAAPATSIQFWGYDRSSGKLAAYLFSPDGVTTKSVVGWNGNNFLARGSDPKTTVALFGNAQSMEWTTGYSDGSSTVETCKR